LKRLGNYSTVYGIDPDNAAHGRTQYKMILQMRTGGVIERVLFLGIHLDVLPVRGLKSRIHLRGEKKP